MTNRDTYDILSIDNLINFLETDIMPPKAERIFLIADELRNAGYIADELSDRILVSLSTRNPGIAEIKQALGDLTDVVDIYAAHKGIVIIV